MASLISFTAYADDIFSMLFPIFMSKDQNFAKNLSNLSGFWGFLFPTLTLGKLQPSLGLSSCLHCVNQLSNLKKKSLGVWLLIAANYYLINGNMYQAKPPTSYHPSCVSTVQQRLGWVKYIQN